MSDIFLIINADDFGWDHDVVDTIIEGHNRGLFTSTSVMTGMPGSQYGIEKLRENPSLGAGIHLCYNDGKPILPPERVPTLVDADTGAFKKEDLFMQDPDSINTAELESEFRAQIEFLHSAGIKPTHIDNHCQYVYFKPEWFQIVLDLSSEYNLPLRRPFDDIFEERVPALAQQENLPEELIRNMGLHYRKLYSSHNLLYTNYFWQEFSHQHRKLAYLLSCIENLQKGTHELLTHPGREDPWRSVEMQIWDNDSKIMKTIENHGIRLINYADLRDISSN